jgi:hypothetical protein
MGKSNVLPGGWAGLPSVRILAILCLALVTGCSDCDRASYSRAEVEGSDADDTGADAGDVDEPDSRDVSTDTDTADLVDAGGDMAGDVAEDVAQDTEPDPDLGLPADCPWALSGCVLLAPPDTPGCGPLGCQLEAPPTLWVDALPCLRRPVEVTLPSSNEDWEILDPHVTEEGSVAFTLKARLDGRARCVLKPQGITFYPEELECLAGDIHWRTSVAMVASACEDCPSVQGCYRAEGFDPPHAVALFQDGCDLTSVAGEPGGRALPPNGTVGPAGQVIFRVIGQVADTICALPPPRDDGMFEGFACAHSQVGLPGDIDSRPEVRLTPVDWSECDFVECVEDADCMGDPEGPACVHGQCSMR